MVPSLDAIEPRGPWKTPLSEEMMMAAAKFGIDAASSGLVIEDFFRIETDESLGAVVTFASAFERIAQYTWLKTQGECGNRRVVCAIRRHRPAVKYSLRPRFRLSPQDNKCDVM